MSNRKIKFPSHLCFALLLGSAVFGCSSTGPKSETDSARIAPGTPPGKSALLRRDSAMHRSRQIHKVGYHLWFGLEEGSEEFAGRAKIVFDVREKAFEKLKSLRVDFTGGVITSFQLNGNPWDAERVKAHYNGEWIEIPKGDLPIGQNRLEIAYSHPYSKSGNGFYRFKDPEDERVYLRTDLEPFDANQVFPSFDQPDLKASFELTVEAPTEWTIIANAPSRDKTKIDGRVSWQFAPSPVMSTYLFALLAGPWKEWKSDADGKALGLYARQSQAKYVDPAEWFRITKAGLAFFSDFFNTAYPYAKYDQILIPDMNAGAMENIGAVTFSEKFIFRGPPTEDQRRGRADTVLHEMAHMWFGNLVTMRWWNGLWLNESFATYMASVALERTKLFPGAPQAFFAGMKKWAYGEDQQPTTHPVEVSVLDTDQASSNFDGITYGKGAAALKQLHFLLGDDDFQEGLHRYFTRFANRNTALADFMGVMAKASDRPLTEWTRTWLRTTGYNTITVDTECEPDARGRNKITKLDLIQSAPGTGNVLRPHQVEVALYYKGPNGVVTQEEKPISATIEGERYSVEEAMGKKCPDLIFPNENDYGYFRTELDHRSVEMAKVSLPKFRDPFSRHLLTHTLWEMVKAGNWKAEEFGTAALAWLNYETNQTLIEDLSEMLASARPNRNSVNRILTGDARAKFSADLFRLARRKAELAKPGSDLQRVWLNLAMKSPSVGDAPWMLGIAEKKVKLSGLKLDPNLRWDLLVAVARRQPIAPEVLAAVAKEDPSSEGQARLLEVKAASPDLSAEIPTHFALEKADGIYPNAHLKKAMSGYLNLQDEERTKAWRPKYFASLENVSAKADDSYYRSFAQALYPGLCSAEVANETTAWLDAHPKAPTPLRVALRKMAFNENWCAAIRAGTPFPLWQTTGSK